MNWTTPLDSDTYGDSILNVGVGTLLTHARNYLDAIVVSASHLGSYRTDDRHLQWGLSYQYQEFYDQINEWELLDSIGYVNPLQRRGAHPERIQTIQKPASPMISSALFSRIPGR